MVIKFYPKCELESKWKEVQGENTAESLHPLSCLRCGRPLERKKSLNAMSRFADVLICQDCGRDEAVLDYKGKKLPLREWFAVKSGEISVERTDGCAVISDECSFSDIFDGPKKAVPLSSTPVPKSKLVHSRSDYDGRRWWTSWHRCHAEALDGRLVQEIDEFQESLMFLPEFKDLYSLKDLCWRYASPTSDPTEFNLYGETAHLNIWIRLITRPRDYNVNVNFYQK